MGCKQKWRTRTRGTQRQIGQAFPLDGQSAQAKRAKLPKAIPKGRGVNELKQSRRVHMDDEEYKEWTKAFKAARKEGLSIDAALAKADDVIDGVVESTVTHYPTGKVVKYSIENMPVEQLDTKSTIIMEPKPKNFEARVQHFIDMYNRGETIPPILFHRRDDGKIQLLDGRARLEAFRRLGLPRIPAVENGILSSIKSGISKAFQGTKGAIEGIKSGKGNWKSEPTSIAQAVGRRVGSDINKFFGQTKAVASNVRSVGASAVEHGKGLMQMLDSDKSVVVRGNAGGGDVVIPSREFVQTHLDGTPVGHRPAVVERKVKGKVLRVYGTLLDPRTNPRYMQKYGYTDVE
jgi:hypothetical protein